jgi:hypothetical protein
MLQLFEHGHRKLRKPQLASEEQADRAGPCDDHVVNQGVLSRVFDRAYASVSISGSVGPGAMRAPRRVRTYWRDRIHAPSRGRFTPGMVKSRTESAGVEVVPTSTQLGGAR